MRCRPGDRCTDEAEVTAGGEEAAQEPERKVKDKPRNRGGYSDRTIIGGKVKSAVIAELESLPPLGPPAGDMERDTMGRQLHFPKKIVSGPNPSPNSNSILTRRL